MNSDFRSSFVAINLYMAIIEYFFVGYVFGVVMSMDNTLMVSIFARYSKFDSTNH